jgi:hypothetical protein
MSAQWCTLCNAQAASGQLECNVGNCGISAYCCAACLAAATCAVCEFAYCASHRTACGDCKGTTCAYCARKLPGDSTIRDLNCFDIATNGLVETEIIASCPLTQNLPAPDYTVFDDFDPPIEMVTYAQSKTASKRGKRPQNVQAEHFVPNSCFIVGTGRSGTVIRGAGLYSEGKALTYWVGDDQMAGTEHKYLTDCERAFCNECEQKSQFPTLGQWLAFMQHATTQSILLHRDYAHDLTALSAADADNVRLAAASKAAYAIRYRMQAHFEKTLKSDLSAHLGNGIVGGAAPPKKVSKGQRYDL